MSRTFAPLALAAVLLAGCGSDPADERRAEVAALTEAANARDADAVRTRAQELADMLAAQRERGDLPAAEADRLLALVERVRAGADLIDEDLLERRRVEAERKKLEEERKRLEEERRKAEEAAREAEERKKGDGKGKGKGKDDEDDD